MELGTRRIRSAGRSSGSIEVTLPACLQDLEGVNCRLLVRDGPRPEIVLQPDLSAAQALLRQLWQLVRVGLVEPDDEVGELGLGEFNLALFPGRAWGARPPLALADVLAAQREPTGPPLARLCAAVLLIAGRRLGLYTPFDLALADALAYLIVGVPAGLGADFERSMAHQRFADHAAPPVGAALALETWRVARPGLRAVFDQLQHWQAAPQRYAAEREHWYRAMAIHL